MDRSRQILASTGLTLIFLAFFVSLIWPGQWVYFSVPPARADGVEPRLIRVHRFTDRTQILEPSLGWVSVGPSWSRTRAAQAAAFPTWGSNSPALPDGAPPAAPPRPAGQRRAAAWQNDVSLDMGSADRTRVEPAPASVPPFPPPNQRARTQPVPALTAGDRQRPVSPDPVAAQAEVPGLTDATGRLAIKPVPSPLVRPETAVMPGSPQLSARPGPLSAKKSPRAAAGKRYRNMSSKHQVQAVSADGRFLRLEDGSLWAIAGQDRMRMSSWNLQSGVRAVQGVNPLYPYELVREDSGERIRARFLRE